MTSASATTIGSSPIWGDDSNQGAPYLKTTCHTMLRDVLTIGDKHERDVGEIRHYLGTRLTELITHGAVTTLGHPTVGEFLENDCGVTAELVPWAEAGSKFSWDFEQETAYLAQKSDKTTVSHLMRIAWEKVGTIIERVVKRTQVGDSLDGLREIGVDEIAYRKHHHYLTVVVNHVTGKIVWMHPGKNAETLGLFFKDLGPARRKLLDAVTLDMSAAYIEAVRAAAPQAKLVFDRFHVQRLVHNALDEVRRAEMREHGKATEEGQALKRSRWATQKNPWDLTQAEKDKLSQLQRTNKTLYRAYLLKESLADLLGRRQVNVARAKLLEWISWALHSRMEPFAKAARTMQKHLEGILAYVESVEKFRPETLT